MSDRLFTLFLSLFLTLEHVCSGFQAWTLLQYNSKDNNLVNVICQHDAPINWTVGATVLINDQNVCKTDKNNIDCSRRASGNQFNFTLKITDGQKKLQCMVYRNYPLPIQVRNGEEIMFPGSFTSAPKPTNSCSILPVANNSLYGLLNWILLGTVLLLCLYSLIITSVFINLRKKISEELSITYVPMQQNRLRPKKGADKNAEYMDMREVQHQVQPFRDMNHNSHLNRIDASI
ncbi:uncharacterized protein si:ch211-67e16.3 isoform X2 [Silurus meridionalis]|uniref:uncharacterized protein si:ch211-67e16.3 isoform X2 n=1 Tax=Silurus meridionalis TaxID=175797 RepID=UPI001EEABB9A|nr:uncharacterized protein si:ch211-67e16.3 isoform X2 [Silurus meridionalis]